MTSIDKKAIKPNIEYLPSLMYAEQHIGTSIGKVVRLHPTITNLENVLQPFWYKNLDYVRGNHLPGRWCIPNVYLKKTDLAQDDTLTITGIDKPIVQKDADKLYWCQIDSTVSELMGCKNVLPLFFDKENPELTVSMTYGLLDSADISRDFISYSNQPNHKKLDVLFAMGLESTGHHFIDFHLLGKNTIDIHNQKNKLAHKELATLDRKDICQAFISCYDQVVSDYQELAHAIKTNQGKYKETIRRYTQKIPIYQDFFGT